jgi:hypothetical protein
MVFALPVEGLGVWIDKVRDSGVLYRPVSESISFDLISWFSKLITVVGYVGLGFVELPHDKFHSIKRILGKDAYCDKANVLSSDDRLDLFQIVSWLDREKKRRLSW